MVQVVLDITTRGLEDAIRNVQGASKLITAGTASRMATWYNQHMKKSMLEVIETGNGVDNNYGKYAMEKESRYGISHGLGLMTGALYFGVSMSQPAIKETRGKEVRFAVRFDDPYYVAFVIDGTSNHVGRDFVTIGKEKTWDKLLQSLGSMFDGLDFTRPYPELMSSILGPSTAPSLTGNFVR